MVKKNVAATPATTGQWTDLIRFPIIPVAAYIVPEAPDTSRMLVFSSWGATTFGGAGGYTQFADYNWKTGAISQRQVSNTDHDMFCPGMSQLQDGKLVITGGSDAEKTSIYDPVTNAFTRGPDMNIARGYQASTTLSNGKIFTVGGSYSGGYGGMLRVFWNSTQVLKFFQASLERFMTLPQTHGRPSAVHLLTQF